MKITNIQEYLLEIKRINESWRLHNATTHAWYRGQSNENWHLEPTIYRGGGTNESEREMIRDFKLNSSRFIDKIPHNDIEWLFIMQHYGMSTRLLDWTESYLTALYFAVLNYRNKKNAAVWVLNPWSLNVNILKDITVPTSEHPTIVSEYCLGDSNNFARQVKGKFPVAIRPNRNTPRIVAQKGVFTIHGYDKRPLNEIIDDLNNSISSTSQKLVRCKKIIIDGCQKKNILRHLMQAGISHSVLFPELEGLAKEINFRYSLEYLGKNMGHSHFGF